MVSDGEGLAWRPSGKALSGLFVPGSGVRCLQGLLALFLRMFFSSVWDSPRDRLFDITWVEFFGFGWDSPWQMLAPFGPREHGQRGVDQVVSNCEGLSWRPSGNGVVGFD